MKVPCCSVCQTRYNEEERTPLLLQCGHGFCRECLSRMFSASQDTTLPCPRCRHVSVVGNSVQYLRKNYAVLALIHSNAAAAANLDCDYTDDDEDGEGDDDREDGEINGYGDVGRRTRGCGASCTEAACGTVLDLVSHQEVKLVRKIGEGRRAGVETWAAVVGGARGRCRHRVTVKKVALSEGMEVDWVQGKLDNLRRATMWCRNVCTFHGSVRMDGSLGLVMESCYGSVQSEMQRNEGRLTLEQILRFS